MAFAPGVEVNGQTVHSVIDGLGAFKDKAILILKNNGIAQLSPDHWYPQQAWLNAFKEIAEKVGAAALFSIGLRIPGNAKFPPEIDSLGKALKSIDVAYHMNHRGGDIGVYRFERIGDNEAHIVCHNPYPCDFDRGIIEAFCKRFRPKGSMNYAQVTHQSGQCRKNQGDTCVYVISW